MPTSAVFLQAMWYLTIVTTTFHTQVMALFNSINRDMWYSYVLYVESATTMLNFVAIYVYFINEMVIFRAKWVYFLERVELLLPPQSPGANVIVSRGDLVSPGLYCRRAVLPVMCFQAKWHESWTIFILPLVCDLSFDNKETTESHSDFKWLPQQWRKMTTRVV